MTESTQSYFEQCLYFTANALAREITRMAEKRFAPLELSPSHAFLIMLTTERGEPTQKELAQELALAQSTVSRFVDSLVSEGLLAKESRGRSMVVTSTRAGSELLPRIHQAWKGLYDDYVALLGEEAAVRLTGDTRKAFLGLKPE